MLCASASLQRFVEHETVVDPTIVSLLFGRRRQTDPLAVLSARGREVLGLIAGGLSAGPSQRLEYQGRGAGAEWALDRAGGGKRGCGHPRLRVRPRLRCRVASWWPADRTGAAA